MQDTETVLLVDGPEDTRVSSETTEAHHGHDVILLLTKIQLSDWLAAAWTRQTRFRPAVKLQVGTATCYPTPQLINTWSLLNDPWNLLKNLWGWLKAY